MLGVKLFQTLPGSGFSCSNYNFCFQDGKVIVFDAFTAAKVGNICNDSVKLRMNNIEYNTELEVFKFCTV